MIGKVFTPSSSKLSEKFPLKPFARRMVGNLSRLTNQKMITESSDHRLTENDHLRMKNR